MTIAAKISTDKNGVPLLGGVAARQGWTEAANPHPKRTALALRWTAAHRAVCARMWAEWLEGAGCPKP